MGNESLRSFCSLFCNGESEKNSEINLSYPPPGKPFGNQNEELGEIKYSNSEKFNKSDNS